jgi:branched-chain amino acid transport system substrate-binding protein
LWRSDGTFRGTVLVRAFIPMAREAPAANVKIIDVIELSGAGAAAGTNWRNGVDLAASEINVKGGLLGHLLEVEHYDTQTSPSVARALVLKALDEGPYAILGPIFSGSIKACMTLTEQAQVVQIVGGVAAELTQQGNRYIFRAAPGQDSSMAVVADYIRESVKARRVTVLWVNNDFGKGGRDVLVRELGVRGIEIALDASVEPGQVNFAADVTRAAAAGADAVFVYLNEEESARFLREARKQGLAAPIVGGGSLLGQKVIDLAGDAANGIQGVIGLTADAPVEALQAFKARFQSRFGYIPDHNAIEGSIAVYAIKAATQRIGRVDRTLLAGTLHGLTIRPSEEPGILLETTWDDRGEVYRANFIGEVLDGKHRVVKILPKGAESEVRGSAR